MNFDVEWADVEWSSFPRLKGAILSQRYPVIYIWTKGEQIIQNSSQLRYYNKVKRENNWESLWEIKEKFLNEWEKQRKNADIEDEMVFEDMYETVLPYLFGEQTCDFHNSSD